MKQSALIKNCVCAAVVILLIFGTGCFSFVNWNPVLMGQLSYFIYGGIFAWALISLNRLPSIRLPLLPIIAGLLLFSLPCVISRYILHGESPVDEIKFSVFPTFSVLIFVILYAYHISPKMLMKYITLVGIAIFVIQVFQVIFPNRAMFGVYSPDESMIAANSDDVSEIRNGLHRFRLESYMITLLCLYYYWDGFLKRKTSQNFILFTIFLVSVYLNLTRQLILASMVTLFVSFFFIKGKSTKLFFVSLAGIAIVALLKFAPALFSGFLENMGSEMTSDNIRLVAFAYFLSDIFSGPVSFLFGNGHPSLLTELQETMRIYTSDIGIVGAWNHYGIFWILLYFFSVYILLIKYRRQLPLFAKLFFLSTLFTSPLIFPYRGGYEYVIWAVSLYFSSYSILHNKNINAVHNRHSCIQKEVPERGGAELS